MSTAVSEKLQKRIFSIMLIGHMLLRQFLTCSFVVLCVFCYVMSRSNRKFNIALTRSNLGYLTTFCARGVGNMTGKDSRGGEFDLCLGGVGKIEQEV